MKKSLKIFLAVAVVALTVAACWTRTSEKPGTDTPAGDVKIDTGAVKIDSGRVGIDTLNIKP